AVDAMEVEPSYLFSQLNDAAILRSMKRRLSEPEIACAMSHMRAYKEIVSERLPGGIILEDDAIITPRFTDAIDFFNTKQNEIASDWAVYQLGLSQKIFDHTLFKRKSIQHVSGDLKFSERARWL